MISQPYFYIIQHKQTKRLYAGSRRAVGCNPNEFMTPTGYKTSSSAIHRIIESEGIGVFDIIRIDTNLDGCSAIEYETAFLRAHNCGSSTDWYNSHNNIFGADSRCFFGSPEYKQVIKNLYGVDNVSQNPDIKQKKIDTFTARYGVSHNSQLETVKKTKLQKSFEKYGTSVPLLNPEIRERSRLTMIEKYGVDNCWRSPEIIERRKQTSIQKYGHPCSLQNEDILERIKQNNLRLYGVEHSSQREDNKERRKNTNLKKYGATTALNSEYGRAKAKETLIRKYGVDNHMHLPHNIELSRSKLKQINENNKSYYCQVCSQKIKSEHNMNQHIDWHKKCGHISATTNIEYLLEPTQASIEYANKQKQLYLQKMQSRDQRFACDQCEFCGKNERMIQNHKKRHHKTNS